MKKSEIITLRKLNLKKNISKIYQNWMNDSEVQQYTEQKYKKHSLADIRNFVREKNKSKNDFLYGIFLKKNNFNIHIGNIKLGPVNFIHKSAHVSFIIGEKILWGKGYATLAIKEIIKIAKKKDIKKLIAGTYEKNIGSQKTLLNNGFKIEGIQKSEVIYKGKRISVILLGKTL